MNLTQSDIQLLRILVLTELENPHSLLGISSKRRLDALLDKLVIA